VNGNGNGKKKRKRIIIIGIIVGVVLVCALGLYAVARGGTKIDPSKLAKVEKGDLAKSVVATGKVTPITKVEVKSKASGIVKKLLVDYGDNVKKGQLLAEIVAPELIKKVNKDSVAQAVLPIREMTSLFAMFVNPLQLVLLGLTVLIVIVSGIGILVSIYNSMSERRHEIAVMRALGAGRRTVMAIVLLESILLSLAGGLVGWLIGHALIAALSPWITVQTGVSVGAMQFVGYELVIIPGLIVLASLVGYLPALAAYRTDVAKALSATP